MRKFLLSMALVLLSGATMAQDPCEGKTRLTAEKLNNVTQKLPILIRCMQRDNHNTYYNHEERRTPDTSKQLVYYWVPVTNGTPGEYYIMKGDGESDYLQTTNVKTYGTIDNAAKFYAVKPYSGGTAPAGLITSDFYEDAATGGDYYVRIAFTDNSKWINLNNDNYNTGEGVWTVQNVYDMSEVVDAFAISKQLTAAELMTKTEPVYIAIKNLSYTNNRWFVGNTGAVPYSEEEFTNDAVFVWEPVTEGTAGSYRLKKLNGDYMQTSASKDFGTVDAAATFTVTNPTSAGTGATHFNGDGDSNPYITGSDDANLVRFVKGSNWINIQNGAGGTPTYNTGTGGWTIHYVYELTLTDTYEASITDAGYATFYVPANVEIPEGVKAYYITSEGINTDYVSMTEITTGVIPANTAVVLEGAEGNYTFNVSSSGATAVSGNLLKGTFTSMNIEGEAYVLSNPDEGVGLYKTEMTEIQLSNVTGKKSLFLNNANKAYLPASAVPAAAQASNGFRFGEGTTGIDEITDNRVQSTAIYDLTGRRVEAITAPGIYIVGGRKVLVK